MYKRSIFDNFKALYILGIKAEKSSYSSHLDVYKLFVWFALLKYDEKNS